MITTTFNIPLSLLLLSATLGSNNLLAAAATAPVTVVTTIKPLQLIAEAITGSAGTVTVMVPPRNSPHHYNLSPSDRLAVERADLILWIGKDFEIRLADFMQAQAAAAEQAEGTDTAAADPAMHTKVITAAHLPDIHRVYLADTLTDTGQQDYHLWLDTRNAALIATAVAEALSHRHPARWDYFQQNLQGFHSTLAALQAEASQLLAPADALNYAVYHDSLRHFEAQFGISPSVPPLLRDPEQQPTIKEIQQTRARLAQHPPACVLTEPGSDPRLIATLLGDLPFRQVPIDHLGSDATDYPSLIRNIVEQLSICR